MTDDYEPTKIAKRRAGRSPSYPFITVQKAIEQAAALYSNEGDYAAPLNSATEAWGYSPKSSGGRQTLATLKYYGLIEIAGEGDDRKIKVSEIAKRIINDEREDTTEKQALIRKVALTPTAHKLLFEEYPNGLPSDATVRFTLQNDHNFNKEAANDLLEEFKATASYAGIYKPQEVVDKIDGIGDKGGVKNPPVIKVGDRIQATVAGVDMFPDGATVLGFNEDGTWVFTDQSTSGVSVEEVTVMEAAVIPPPIERPKMPAHLMRAAQDDVPPEGMRKAIFPLSEGDVTMIFPEGLSTDALTDLGDYLDVFLRKEKRGKTQ